MGRTHWAGHGKRWSENEKVAHFGPRWELAMKLGSYLKTYLIHLKLATTQMSAYKECKTSLKDIGVLIAVDFAKNFKCKQFAEAQLA